MTVGREFNLELTALSRSRKYRLIQIRINLFIGRTWIADYYDGIGWKKLDSLVYHGSARGQHELVWPSVGSTGRVPFCAHRTNNWCFPTDLKPASTLIPGMHFLHLKFRLGQHYSSPSRWKGWTPGLSSFYRPRELLKIDSYIRRLKKFNGRKHRKIPGLRCSYENRSCVSRRNFTLFPKQVTNV